MVWGLLVGLCCRHPTPTKDAVVKSNLKDLKQGASSVHVVCGWPVWVYTQVCCILHVIQWHMGFPMCCIFLAMKLLSARFTSLLVELSTVDIFFQCVTCLVLFFFCVGMHSWVALQLGAGCQKWKPLDIPGTQPPFSNAVVNQHYPPFEQVVPASEIMLVADGRNMVNVPKLTTSKTLSDLSSAVEHMTCPSELAEIQFMTPVM